MASLLGMTGMRCELECSQHMGLHSSVGRVLCSANTEAMDSNPIEALKIFFRLTFAVAQTNDTTAMVTSLLQLIFGHS